MLGGNALVADIGFAPLDYNDILVLEMSIDTNVENDHRFHRQYLGCNVNRPLMGGNTGECNRTRDHMVICVLPRGALTLTSKVSKGLEDTMERGKH